MTATAETGTDTAVDVIDPLDALTDTVNTLAATITDLVDQCTDPHGAGLAGMLLQLREARDRLMLIDTEVERALIRAMSEDTLEVEGVLHAERRRSRDRKEWRHEDWQRDVRDKMLRRHGLLGAAVFGADGEELPLGNVTAAISEAQACHGSTAPRLTSLRGIGLDPEEYCSTSPGTTAVAVRRSAPVTAGEPPIVKHPGGVFE